MKKREKFGSVFLKRLTVSVIVAILIYIVTFIALDIQEVKRFNTECQAIINTCAQSIGPAVEEASSTQAKRNRTKLAISQAASGLMDEGIRCYIELTNGPELINDSSEAIAIWCDFDNEAGNNFFCYDSDTIAYFKERMDEAECRAGKNIATTYFVPEKVYFTNQSEFVTPKVYCFTKILNPVDRSIIEEYEDSREFATKAEEEYYHSARGFLDAPQYGAINGEMTLVGVDTKDVMSEGLVTLEDGSTFKTHMPTAGGGFFTSRNCFYARCGNSLLNIELYATYDRLSNNLDRYILLGICYLAGGVVVSLIASVLAYNKLKALYEVDDYRRNLVNCMAHDLRTPITVMLGYADNLTENVHTEKRDHYAEAIKENAEYMNSIIGNILNLSRLESGYVLNKCTVNLIELSRNLWGKYEPMASDRSISASFVGEMTTDVDKEMIAGAIDNLLSNALNYSKAGTSIVIEGKGGKYSIRNTMDGTIDVKADELWNPFVKGDNSRGSKKGNGLGLSIVRNILEAHGFSPEIKICGGEFEIRF